MGQRIEGKDNRIALILVLEDEYRNGIKPVLLKDCIDRLNNLELFNEKEQKYVDKLIKSLGIGGKSDGSNLKPFDYFNNSLNKT